MKQIQVGRSENLASYRFRSIGVAVSNYTHSYDNYVSWDVSFEGGTASQIYKTGNVSSYKGVNFIGQGRINNGPEVRILTDF